MSQVCGTLLNALEKSRVPIVTCYLVHVQNYQLLTVVVILQTDCYIVGFQMFHDVTDQDVF